jgi:uncharacterized protein YecE (DUF72 family)
MLSFYAKEFSTVEINHSFYRMPVEPMLQKWAGQVPEGFRFAMKANQQITHIMRLRGVESALKRFLEAASVLQDGDHLGPVLVQLPPSFKFDRPLLEEFLGLRPTAFRFAFEVRHASWYAEETYETLRKFNTSLCLAETDEAAPPDVQTADFVYLRLRKENYSAAELQAWRTRFDKWTAQGKDVYVYIKHEDAGKGPAYARVVLGRSASLPDTAASSEASEEPQKPKRKVDTASKPEAKKKTRKTKGAK